MNGAQAKVFIQNAITDTGEQIAQQNGEFLLQDHDPAHAAADSWDDDLKSNADGFALHLCRDRRAFGGGTRCIIHSKDFPYPARIVSGWQRSGNSIIRGMTKYRKSGFSQPLSPDLQAAG